MKGLLPILFLIILVGCAKKYIVPANRFVTAESQGGSFKGQFEIQKSSANQLSFDTSNDDFESGVNYKEISRSGYLLSLGLAEPFDLMWSHTSSANSMIGGKFQFLGAPGKGTGHKMSAAILIGSNEHEAEEGTFDFTLSGREFLYLYGYRVSENVFPYSSFSYSTYTFDGDYTGNESSLRNKKAESEAKSISFSGGVEVSYDVFMGKLELTYQMLSATKSSSTKAFIIGYSLGLIW